MRLELSVCTCYWMTHRPSQLAAVPRGATGVGLSKRARGERTSAAEGRDQPLRSPSSSSSHPSVPNQLCGRRMPCEWFAG